MRGHGDDRELCVRACDGRGVTVSRYDPSSSVVTPRSCQQHNVTRTTGATRSPPSPPPVPVLVVVPADDAVDSRNARVSRRVT